MFTRLYACPVPMIYYTCTHVLYHFSEKLDFNLDASRDEDKMARFQLQYEMNDSPEPGTSGKGGLLNALNVQNKVGTLKEFL